MLFKNEGLMVRKLQAKDNHLLVKWLSDPMVLEFYEGRDNSFVLEKVNKLFYNAGNDKVGCMVTYQGVNIGYIQYYPLDERTCKIYHYDGVENIYGIDQFIGETDYWNRGIGTQLVKSMVEYLFNQMGAERVVMDPQTSNKRALRSYEECGFKRVRMLPKHELHEGEYRDCWLMEYS